MSRSLKQTLERDWRLLANWVSADCEAELVASLDGRFAKLPYEDAHFDAVITKYREFIAADDWQPALHAVKLRAQELLRVRLMPLHCIDLKGQIGAHTDNAEYSGSIVAGLSLLATSTIRFTRGQESESILLPRRSLYIMKDDLRYNFKHEISLIADSAPTNRRISIVFRDSKAPRHEV